MATVLITRPVSQATDLQHLLQQRGLDTICYPVIAIQPPQQWLEADAAIDQLGQFDWLIFASVNGVRFFLQRCQQRTGSIDVARGCQIAAIGQRTTSELQTFGLNVDLSPPQADSQGLAQALIQRISQETLLLIRGDRGSRVLAQGLAVASINFREIVVYRSIDLLAADPSIVDLLTRGEIDWVTVTSSAIARNVARLFGDALKLTRLASISPTTTQQLSELGYPPAVEATRFDMQGIVAAICSQQN